MSQAYDSCAIAVERGFRSHEVTAALHFIRLTPPTENGIIESFNGRLREECLITSCLETLEETCEVIESRRTDYNEMRLHSSLVNIPPAHYEPEMSRWRAQLNGGRRRPGAPGNGSGSLQPRTLITLVLSSGEGQISPWISNGS